MTTDKSRADALTESAQFLTDVVTAAGLLSHGRTDKKLATRIAEQAFELRKRMHLLAASPVEQHEAASKNLKAELRRVMDLLDAVLGDSDHWTEGLTQDEIEEEYPVVAAMQIVVALHEAAPDVEPTGVQATMTASTDYVPGVCGWMISKDGRFEIGGWPRRPADQADDQRGPAAHA